MNETRVIIYSPYSPESPGAAGMRVHALKRAFEEKNCRVQILTPSSGGKLKLFHQIILFSPHIVVGTSPPLPPLVNIWAAASVARAKFILDAKDDGRAISILSKKNRTVKEKLYLHARNFLYSNADRVWFLSASDQREAVQRYGLKLSRTAVLSNGTDNRLPFDAAARTRVRKEWRVKGNETVALYAGSLGDEDLDGFIHAAKSIKAFFVFVVSHDSSKQNQIDREKLQQKLSELLPRHKIYDNVSPSTISELFSGADVGVVPWKDDYPTSIPVKTFDYAGTGLYIIAKCSKGSELDAIMNANAAWGVSIPSWSAFASTWKKLKVHRTNTQRTRLGKKVHSDWDRVKIAAGEVARVLSLL